MKKGKAFYEVDNYRGIKVRSVIGKVFEYIIFNKTNLIKSGQSPLLFGFTQGLSPNSPNTFGGMLGDLRKANHFCHNT